MKKKLLFVPVMFLITLSMVRTTLPAQEISAIVSTEWLEHNIVDHNLILLDVRETKSYSAGHIPGSINVPAFPNWYINKPPGEEFPWMELPEKENLFKTIGKAGITVSTEPVKIKTTT